MKILMLGGTGFAGPSMVRRAIVNGHEVTLFNRGKSAPDMFPDVEHVRGDRYSDLSGLEELVKSGRTFDAVIDTFTYVPKTVTGVVDILLPAMEQFLVISTTSVYSSRATAGMDENGELESISDDVANGIKTHHEVGMHYGAMKVRVEKAVEERFPNRSCVIRPGLIVGERDTSGRYSYWPIRASEGGTMIAPGTGDDYIQYIDVRDLGDFTIHCIEQKHMGVYNGISPMGERTSRDMVESAVRVASERVHVQTSLEWVDAKFLETNGVQAWQHMPAWIPNTAEGYEGNGQLNTQKSIAAGLKTRAIDDTTWNTLHYYQTRGKEIKEEQGEESYAKWSEGIRGGLDPVKEQEVLQLWKKKNE